MCKFMPSRAWRSSNKKCLQGNKSRPSGYGSRTFSSNERSNARDLGPKLVWHGSAPRAGQRPFQCGNAYELGSVDKVVSHVWQICREPGDRGHRLSVVGTTQVSSNCGLPEHTQPRLAALLLPLPCRTDEREPRRNPQEHLATPDGHEHAVHNRCGERLHHSHRQPRFQRNDNRLPEQNDKPGPESCRQWKDKDRVEYREPPSATIPV